MWIDAYRREKNWFVKILNFQVKLYGFSIPSSSSQSYKLYDILYASVVNCTICLLN